MSRTLSGRSVPSRSIAASPPIAARGEGFSHPRDRANLYSDGRLKSRDRQRERTSGREDRRSRTKNRWRTQKFGLPEWRFIDLSNQKKLS
ncbi:hypothetical protein J6590_088382 [Homalodisca vitripennis]|nr:hypothetical protein J6590_088382 [Homalodisca vitripennis]